MVVAILRIMSKNPSFIIFMADMTNINDKLLLYDGKWVSICEFDPYYVFRPLPSTFPNFQCQILCGILNYRIINK